MAVRPPLTLDVEKARFNGATRRFLGTLLPAAVDKAVRKMAFDVVRHTVIGLNGIEGLPKRIDTGRLRAGWRVAMANGGLPTTGLPGAANSRPDDGVSVVAGTGTLAAAVTVQNRVEYAGHVEHGTVKMAPGKHLERALRLVRASLPTDPEFGSRIKTAWTAP